jgi:hypothetical protein
VSRTWTNIVRFAVAALLGLAACLVAWWPQSAAGSGNAAALAPMAAAPTQQTPTVSPSHPPTATVVPTSAAPPPAPPPAPPTHKPTSKPTHKPTHHSGGSNGGNNGGSHHHPTTLHNSGGSHNGSSHHSSGSSHSNPPSSTSTHSSAPYVPTVAAGTPVAHPTSHQSPSAPTSAPTTQTSTSDAQAGTGDKGDKNKGQGAGDAETYDTYLTSSEPVESKSAPVWVVPGILIVLTSMLALLGGVLGRGSRPALAPVKGPRQNASDDES